MRSPGRTVLVLAGLLVAAAVVERSFRLEPAARPHSPRPLPELLVQGWVNTDEPPTRETLLGKWVVLDLWTTWCGPCREDAPKLVRLHRLLAGREDLRLIGLNPDPADTPEQIRAYTQELPGYDWPVGYGAEVMRDVLDAPYVPTLILFAPDGQSVWRGQDTRALAEQLERRLGIEPIAFGRR